MKKYALFIGIDRYDDPGITPLHCAVRDARELAGVFKHRLGFQTEVFTHDDLRSGRDVLSEVAAIGKKLGEGDVFVFFFAGHGKAIKNPDDQIFLLPRVSPKSLRKNVIAGNDVLSYRGLRAETDDWPGVACAYILDACRSPLYAEEVQNRDGDGFAQFQANVVYRDLTLGVRAPVAPMAAPFVVLNSCMDQQCAEELPGYNGGHGLFTASLLETLGNYEYEHKPVVIDDPLTEAVAQRMQALARTHGQRQTDQRPLRVGEKIRLFGREELVGQQLTALLADFDRQFADGQLDRPVGDNCLETLRDLKATGFDAKRQQGLSMKLQAALDLREENAKRQRDQRRFDAARRLGTAAAYSHYLAECELGEHAAEAERAIEAELGEKARQAEMAKQRAAALAATQAEQSRMQEMQAAQERQAALDLAEENAKRERDQKRIEAARRVGTAAAYSEFLAECELGEYVEEAKSAIAAELSEKARQVEMEKQHAAALAAMQAEEKRAQEMAAEQERQRQQAAMDELAWHTAQKAHTVEATYAYLHNYPAGQFIEQAQALLRTIAEESVQKKLEENENIRRAEEANAAANDKIGWEQAEYQATSGDALDAFVSLLPTLKTDTYRQGCMAKIARLEQEKKRAEVMPATISPEAGILAASTQHQSDAQAATKQAEGEVVALEHVGFVKKANGPKKRYFVIAILIVGVLVVWFSAPWWERQKLRNAANGGDVAAQNELCADYWAGPRTMLDNSNAFKACTIAAGRRNARAQAILGSLYRVGAGVAMDEKTAFEWYKKAADNNDLLGQYWLARAYEKGEGVAASKADAIYWFKKLVENGDSSANEDLKRLQP